MTPQDLMKKTILAEASKASSDFVEVTHRGVLKKAKVEFGDFRNAKKDNLEGKSIDDDISFLNMQTSFITRGDDITYDGTIYNVEYVIPVVTGVYNVCATKTTRFASGTKNIKIK